jgi:fructokinase
MVGSAMRIGIDLGGTKIEAIALDDRGETLVRRRVPTPSGDYRAILDAVGDLVAFVERETGQRGTIGVASPGAISKQTGVIKNSNSTGLNGKPLDRDLAKRLGREIRIENDANCFALSEAVDGAAADARVVFGVILGTGVGGGLVIDKAVIPGRNRIAGEWGHNPLPWPRDDERPGPRCYCGKAGCIETFLSGPGLARESRDRGGRDLTPEAIALAASNGDREAVACFELYQDRLARSLAGVINVLDPDKIVLGGGLSNIAQLYEKLPAMVERYAFSDGIDTPIVRARHGDSSGVRGAAWLWPAG